MLSEVSDIYRKCFLGPVKVRATQNANPSGGGGMDGWTDKNFDFLAASDTSE